MKQLIKYSYSVKGYINYLNKHKYPTKTLFSTDNIYVSLAYILEYLSSIGIYLLVDKYNYLVYTDRYYKDIEKNNFTIEATNNDNANGTLTNYVYAINVAFKFLNVPF